MDHDFSTATLRVKADTADGFVRVNRDDFDHDAHQLFDKKDAPLVPVRKKAVAEGEDLRTQLAEALDRALEAESERDEWKARAEAAEAAAKSKAAGNK